MNTTRKTRPYRELLLERLADPEVASEYLNVAWEESTEAFLKALFVVAQSKSTMARVAKDSGIKRETLYRCLSDDGNPTLDTLSSILGVIGLKLYIATSAETETVPSGGSIEPISYTASRPAIDQNAIAQIIEDGEVDCAADSGFVFASMVANAANDPQRQMGVSSWNE